MLCIEALPAASMLVRSALEPLHGGVGTMGNVVEPRNPDSSDRFEKAATGCFNHAVKSNQWATYIETAQNAKAISRHETVKRKGR